MPIGTANTSEADPEARTDQDLQTEDVPF